MRTIDPSIHSSEARHGSEERRTGAPLTNTDPEPPPPPGGDAARLPDAAELRAQPAPRLSPRLLFEASC